ncbi:Rim13p ASCRUDRAFT_81993 [Ascoidea rubescens DSM 1968]|uniref:Cysteine protease RIM13 n=1 Tax=Ascoidea rubescens DSM 1968 TaxID=1344418 RepID=A0A1D2VDR8_9ASCO|nr:hypothetical protein ASCRUDRAFT_81993 [Ascoidea rubescens DSM 1968]ODV59732.1 hypothetical protein ASCRUDRAFT_81993 [Ascoidea rubescens DSM 1968]
MEKELYRYIDEAQRNAEHSKIKYSLGNLLKARLLSLSSINSFSQVLFLIKQLENSSNNYRHDKKLVEIVKELCNAAIEYHSNLTKDQNCKKLICLNDKIAWLSSIIKQDNLPPSIYPPVFDDFNKNSIIVNPYDSQFDLENSHLKLSKFQSNHLLSWSHSKILIKNQVWSTKDKNNYHRDLLHLYQNRLNSNCSLVSSFLSILNKTENINLLLNQVQPHHPSFKYSVFLYFNGYQRLILTDDVLPFSTDAEKCNIFINSSHNHDIIWPALIEKGYLKLFNNNSYDFVGSNAGIDIYRLIGWFPQFINLKQYQSINIKNMDKLWNLIYENFKKNNCVLSVGTGKIISNQSEYLISNHDYSILNLNLDRKFLIKNPWLNTTTAATATNCNNNSSKLINKQWINFDYLLRNFDTLYINWNPKIFPTKKIVNFISLVNYNNNNNNKNNDFNYLKPQFKIENNSNKPIILWIFIERHYKNFNFNFNIIINNRIIKSNGERILSDYQRNLLNEGNFESYNNFHLVKINLKAFEVCTSIVSSLCECDTNNNEENHWDLETQKKRIKSSISFSMVFYSSVLKQEELKIEKASYKYKFFKEIEGNWNSDNCGGNSLNATYINNPQYEFKVMSEKNESKVDIGLFIENKNILINLQIFWSEGNNKKIEKFNYKKLVFNEKYKSNGNFLIENFVAEKNKKYLFLLSTYDKGLSNNKNINYKLIINCENDFKIKELNNELGLFLREIKFSWNKSIKIEFNFEILRDSKVNIHIVLLLILNSIYRPKIRANIFSNNDDCIQLTKNKEFDDSLYGIFLNELVLKRGKYIILLERFELGEGEGIIKMGSSNQIILE